MGGEKKTMKKERKSPSKKKAAAPANKPKPWPNLPVDIGRSVITGMGGVTKSWISSPSSLSRAIHQTTWPQLVEINTPENRDSVSFNRRYEFWLCGWDENIPIQFCTSDKKMVVTGISYPAFAFFCSKIPKGYSTRMGWITKGCKVIEPYSGDDYRYMEFTNIIDFEGKYYAISRQGSLALIERDARSGDFEITGLGRNRAVPHCKVSKNFGEYLLEYKRVIYLVFLLSRASINVVDDVEVFRLDASRLLWEKVDSLAGDTIFFVEDRCCVGVSATSIGLDCSKRSRGNCVYFSHDRADDTWFVYDMTTKSISITSGPEIDRPVSD